jgi:hypothetical protein
MIKAIVQKRQIRVVTRQPFSTTSDATGATAIANGTHGLLPAPPAGNITDVLRRDLTWGAGGGGGGHTIYGNGSSMPAEAGLNFDGYHAVTDVPGSSWTLVSVGNEIELAIVNNFRSMYGY